MTPFSPDRKAFTRTSCLVSVFFHSVTVNFDAVLSLSCPVLILLFNAFFPRVRESICNVHWDVCVSHTELETRTAQLLSAAKPDFKSERCFKIRIPYCNLQQCCLPAHAPCWFCFFSLPNKGGQFASCTLLRSKRHIIAYPPFCI